MATYDAYVHEGGGLNGWWTNSRIRRRLCSACSAIHFINHCRI